MGTQDSSPQRQDRKRHRARIARLEADIAYFQARLEFIGDPENTNQLAQRKVFKALHKSVANKILNAKKDYSEML